MDLVKKYLDLAEAWPGTPEWKKKHDPSYNPYDPEGKQRKALKQMPYGYRAKSVADDEETPASAEQPAMKKRGRPKKMKEEASLSESLPASKALQRAHDAERKKRGLPDPSYYLKLAAQKKKEIEDMKKEDEAMKKESVNSPPFTPDKKKKPSAIAGKFGMGYSTARHLARTGMQAALKDLKKGPEKGKRQVEEVDLEEEESAHVKLMNHHANLAKEAAKKGYEFGNKNNIKKSEHFYALADKHVDASYAHEKAAKTNNPQHSKDAYAATKEVNSMAMKEEVEQVNELKTSTVQSYMQKRGDRQSRVATAMKDIETGSNKSKVHSAGLKRAAARMNKLTPTAPRKWPSADEIKRGQSEIPKWWTYGT